MKIFSFFSALIAIISVQAAPIEMAITVDDLPAHGQLPAGVTRLEVVQTMLAALKKHQVPEVYGFINAGKVEFNKADLPVLQAWREAGYPLGNHGYSHMDLHKANAADFTKDIQKNEALLKELNGTADWKYFRYPFLREGDVLEKRNAVRAYLSEHQYKIAQVTVDFEDWTWNNPYARCADKKDKKPIASLKKTYLDNAVRKLDQTVKITDYLFKRPVNHVLLLHVGAFDAVMLDDLLMSYKKKGVKFIPLSEALQDDIYKLDPAVVGKWGSELQFQVLKSKGIKMKDTGAAEVAYPEDALRGVCL